MTSTYAPAAARRPNFVPGGLDRLGLLLTTASGLGVLGLPFLVFKANRIVSGDGLLLWKSASPTALAVFLVLLAVTGLVAVFVPHVIARLGMALAALAALALFIGHSADRLVPPDDRYARVGIGSGAWLLLFTLLLMATDAFARLRPPPLVRIGALAAALVAAAGLFSYGLFDDLAVMKEYAVRADLFWHEAGRHMLLALGSMAAALIVGLPLGFVCHRYGRLRRGILNLLNIVQTIPSIALFGLLMGPLGALAAAFPPAHALGLRGIGPAPAALALFLYALLPVVTNTVVGLSGVPAAVLDAARGMGLTRGQRFRAVEFPLALPVILTGVRIVLVQNIGLATVAALIGGGGFGTLVFQGLGQTALDLVLLGAIPTILLAVGAAVLLDAVIEAAKGGEDDRD